MGPEVRERVAQVLARAGVAHVDRRRVAVVAGLAVVLVLVCVVRWWPSRADEFVVEHGAEPVEASATASANAERSADSTSCEPQWIYVHVVGAVRSGGLVRLSAGSRIADAISAAGGLLSNAEVRAVNLARPAVDGEQVFVPTMDEWAAGSAVGSAPGSGPGIGASGAGADSGLGIATGAGTKVDLNSADAAALDALPGVGPSTAAKIIADREANGPFTAPEDLMRVSGIGEKKFEALKEYLVVR